MQTVFSSQKKIKMKKILPALFSITISVASFSQAPDIEWQNTIGGAYGDWLYSVIQVNDGGYFLGGFSDSDSSGEKTEDNFAYIDYWIIMLNDTGSIEWQKTIGAFGDDKLYEVQQTKNHEYILAGISSSTLSGDKTEPTNGQFDYWILKIDSLGEIILQNTIGGALNDYFICSKQAIDGGFILIGGYSASGISGDKTEASEGLEDYWIVKIDSELNIQWQNTIGGSGTDVLNSIEQTTDGGYILGGYSNSVISGDKTDGSMGFDYWIIKLDSTGNLLWQKTIGGSIDDLLYSIQKTDDGGYILGGSSNSPISGDKTEDNYGSYDYWVIKLDSLGNIMWQNTIGGNLSEFLDCTRQTWDGGYIVGGTSISPISGEKDEASKGAEDYWIIKLDSFGNILWQKVIGGSAADVLYDFNETADGGFILGGISNSDISGDKTENNMNGDYWVVKLEGNCTPSEFYADNDGDGFGDITETVAHCTTPPGYVSNNTDCNDSDAATYPGAEEICNEFDDNCNGDIDEGLSIFVLYYDNDNDGYGNILIDTITCLTEIIEFVADSTDCDDANNLIHEPVLYYADTDGDLYGDSLNADFFCILLPPSGYVPNSLDCDDSNPFINPFSNEILNGLDDNCNDTIDDGLVLIENAIQLAIEVFPNPNSGNFKIRLPELSISEVRIEILNALGEKIYSNRFIYNKFLIINLPVSYIGPAWVIIIIENMSDVKLITIIE